MSMMNLQELRFLKMSVEQAEQKRYLDAKKKEAAKEQLLRIQLLISRNSQKKA